MSNKLSEKLKLIGSTIPLEEKTLLELKKIAKVKGIKGYSTFTSKDREKLITLIKEQQKSEKKGSHPRAVRPKLLSLDVVFTKEGNELSYTPSRPKCLLKNFKGDLDERGTFLYSSDDWRKVEGNLYEVRKIDFSKYYRDLFLNEGEMFKDYKQELYYRYKHSFDEIAHKILSEGTQEEKWERYAFWRKNSDNANAIYNAFKSENPRSEFIISIRTFFLEKNYLTRNQINSLLRYSKWK